MQTKRKYAHELYPHAAEWEVRPLSVEVPYLLARAVGLTTFGTGWRSSAELLKRVEEVTSASEIALLADALHQGLSGDAAWVWAAAGGEGQAQSELVYERALHYGVPVSLIKPYPCGPTPDGHDHMSSTGDATGYGIVTRIDIPEDQCPTCCEPEAGGAS